jgi:hypothetical protein
VESSDESPPEGPPPDPDDWTDEQWIAWLKQTDATVAEAAAPPVTAFGRLTHSSGGSVLGQAMLGMADALYGREKNEVVIVVEGSGQPVDDEPFAVHLDPDHPERSVVVLRSHLRKSPGEETSGEGHT